MKFFNNNLSYFKIILLSITLALCIFSFAYSQNQGSNFVVFTEGVKMTGSVTCYPVTPRPTLYWDYEVGFFSTSGTLAGHDLVGAGKAVSRHRIQVDNNSNFSSPEYNSGWINNAATSRQISGLNYNTTYYWRIEVSDTLDWNWAHTTYDQRSNTGWINGRSFVIPVACP